MSNNIIQRLTEGVQQRDLRKEGAAMVTKWEETGLLEGLKNERQRNNMALLLENQAKELLREASTMAAGDVEGFAAVAFPLVRRVFGSLIANDLVSVQPMSLPNGLIFFLDFFVDASRLAYQSTGNSAPFGDSVYGGGALGRQLTGGVSLTGLNAEKGFYNLNNGYSSPTSSVSITYTVVASGTYGDDASGGGNPYFANNGPSSGTGSYIALRDALLQFDPDIASGTMVVITTALKSAFTNLDTKDYITISASYTQGRQARRLTVDDPTDPVNKLMFVVFSTSSTDVLANLGSASGGAITTSWVQTDARVAGGALGSVVGTTPWGLENVTQIPELDIKVDSISIQANTKKLKAKWTPELQQDIQAYQNLDAEVELTSILSEHVALEIDQEILEDLVKGATAGTYYWSRRPGKFINRTTGAAIANTANELIFGLDFTGNVSEWYETLIETINDVSAQIHRKTLRGGANFIVCGPEVANILEMTAGFRASVTHDEDRGEVGTLKVGAINKKWDVYVDPYFMRQVILIGRKGSSFLESGYVFAPYVPLQVTPTIFGTEDFVPRKGVMTRFGRQMVRPDFYGLCIVLDMFG